MGSGVLDVEVDTDLRAGIFSHTLYWTMARDGTATDAVDKLRAAIDLGREL
jgi:hypothetical protein